MPSDAAPSRLPVDSPTAWYSYAIVRVVPRVERGECVNVGVLLFAPTRRFLGTRIELDVDRLLALAPDVDPGLVERHLATFQAIAEGRSEGGPLAALPPSDRFHHLTAPRSTVIQTSAVHVGRTDDPPATLERLLGSLVRQPGRERLPPVVAPPGGRG